jgi:hypothetical protein
MFREVFIAAACPLFSNVSGSVGIVFNLTESTSLYGLTIRSLYNEVLYIDSTTPVTRVGSMMFVNNRNHNLHLISATTFPYIVPLMRAYEPLICLEQPASLSITPRSSFAGQFNTAMLLPPSEEYPTFRLIAGLTEPGTHCYEGTMGYADMPQDQIRLNGQVSLIVPTESTSGERTTSRMDSQRTSFGIITDMNEHVLPSDIFMIWENQLLFIAGVWNRQALDTLDWSTFIDRLPSIQYTIFRSDESDEVVATIVFEPRDFIEILPLGANVLLSPSFFSSSCSLGIAALKHVSVFLDYAESQIGFCEPI